MTKILTMCAAMWMLCGTVFAQAPATGKNFSISLKTLPMTYQWKKDGTAISGATGSSYKINSVKSGDAGSYTVTVSNSAGNVTSSAATLTVNGKPAITTQPKSQTIAEGNSVTFSVTASGGNLKYQWKKNGTAISGAAKSSYTISSVTSSDAGSYTVTVSNSAGNVTSSAATLTVAVKPTISTQPKSQAVTEGNAVTFTVSATGIGLSYQWYQDGSPVSGATGASYNIKSVKPSDDGIYTVKVSNIAGSVTSSSAKLTVNLKAPVITVHPKSQTIVEGKSVTFSVTASGSELTYRWRKDNGGVIVGATSSSYTINNVSPTHAGNYTVMVSNSAGTVTSSAATLTVVSKPTINTQPKSQTVTEGDAVTFTVSATGIGLSYQWKKDGSNINGATSASYTISSAKSSDAGKYTVSISNLAGSETSSDAILTVNFKSPLSIITQPKSRIVSEGSSVSFSVATSGDVMDMVWIEPGAFIMGSSTSETGDEQKHQVTISKGFWLGKYEVTQAQYFAVMGSNTVSALSYAVGDNHPVHNVSWNNAKAFCTRLTDQEKAAGRLPEEYEYTLPTEAQWEYACRAGTTTDLNSGMNLSNAEQCYEMDEVGWYWGNSMYNNTRQTYPVGQKLPNAWGLYDMHGNVSEWCLDWYGSYPSSSVTDPTGPYGSKHVLRGGNYNSVAGSCRSAKRESRNDDNNNIGIGFRVALVTVGTVIEDAPAAGGNFNVSLPLLLNYQWKKDGIVINGATNASYKISSVKTSDAGSYMVTVSNRAGSVVSSPAVLTVGRTQGNTISHVYKKGKYAKVTLKVAPEINDNSYFVEDVLPLLSVKLHYDITMLLTNSSVIPLNLTNDLSMSITNSYGGYYSPENHAIRWNFFDASPRDVQYVVKVPWNCYEKMDLDGKVTFTEVEKDIIGERAIDFSDKLHPADLNDYMDISTQEIANYCMAWKRFRNWERSTPATGSKVVETPYAARGVQIWLYGSDYLYKSAKLEPSCWIAEWEPQVNSASDEYLDMGEQIPEDVVRAAAEGDSTSTRTIRKNGNTATVSLSLRPDPEVIFYFVEEIVPVESGIEISNVSDGGVYLKEKGTIRWAIMDGSAKDLSYTVKLASGYTGIVTLTGSTTFNTTEVQTTGDSVISDVTAPSITTQPKSQTVNEGSSVTFSVAVNGTEPLSYQWKKDGVPISGATKSSYTISSAKTSDAGSYTVTVSNNAGNVTSSAATLTVKTEPPPTGLSVRRSVNVTGNKANVTLTISNAPKGYFGSLEETWQNKNVTFSAISDGGTAAEAENGIKVSWSGFDMSGNYQFPGTLTYTATVPEGFSGTVSLSGQLMITTPSGTTNADIDTVNVSFTAAPAAPVIITQPKSQSVSEGGSVTFSVTATGSAPLIYQWFKNNSLLSGANGSSYTIPSASTNDAGTYMVMVTNAQGAVMSTPVTLTVTQGGVPELKLVEQAGGKWKITFTGTLQESTDMKSWKNVSGTQSGAYTFTPAKGKKFYRAVK